MITKKQKNKKTEKPFFGFYVPSFFRQSKASGFTLIELLIVMAILTVLFAMVIIAINPTRQLSQADNSQRRSDINAILNAVYQHSSDNRGALPAFVPSTSTQQIGSLTSGCAISCGATTTLAVCLNLHTNLVSTYLVDIPKDPDQNSTTTTHYAITKSASDNRIAITACDAEIGATISVSR